MKKIISSLLCIVLLFGVFACGVSAKETNLCGAFETVEWFEACYNFGAENSNSFDAKIVYRYISNEISQSGKYDFKDNVALVPEAEFEALANKWFKTTSSIFENIKALKYNEYFEISDNGTNAIYSAGKYAVVFAGGRSYDQEYFLEGYVSYSDKYDVYLNYRTISDQKPAGKEGADYFIYENQGDTYYAVPTKQWMKYTVTYDNSQIKYISTVKVTALPEALIKPGDVIGSTSSSTSSATSSDTSLVSSQVSSSTSSDTSSGVTSSEEEHTPPSVIHVETIAKISGAELKAAEGVFPLNTAFSVTRIEDGIAYESAKTALGSSANRFVAFNITAANAGMPVQPNGTVTAVFDIPEGYEITKLAVIYVSEDGKTEILPSIVDEKSKTITAELSHFSTFVVAEMLTETNVTVKKDSTGIIILVVVLVVLFLAGAGFLVWFLVFYRKKAKKPLAENTNLTENDDDMIIFP